jgi:hypothetical protein
MRISRAALAATVLAGVTAVGFGLSIGTAVADSDQKLPIKSFGDIAVDKVHQRVFVSDPTSGKIVATNYQGHELTEVANLTGAQGLALSADSSRLYAVLGGADAIVAFSTESLTELDRYPVGAGLLRGDVAVYGDKLWFSCDRSRNVSASSFGSLDLTTRAVNLHKRAAEVSFFGSPPELSWHPSAPGLLTLTDARSTGGDIAVYNVSTGTEELQFETSANGYVDDVAIAGDGSHLYRAGHSGTYRIGVPDGVGTKVFTDLEHFNAIDIARDGQIAVSVRNNTAANDLAVFAAGATEPKLTFALPKPPGPGSDPQVVKRGIAWEPGGPRLFAIATDDQLDYWLYTLNDPDPVEPDPTVTRESWLELHAPLSSPWGTRLEMSGMVHVIWGDHSNPEPNVTDLTLNVTRYDSKTPSGTALKDLRTDAWGSYRFTDLPPSIGEYRYVLSFPGDASFTASSIQRVVKVDRATPSLTLTRSPQAASYAHGSTVNITATLGKTYRNRVAEIWADPHGSEPNRLLKRATVNSAGKLATSVKVTRNTWVTARFTGDEFSNPTSYRMNVLSRVNASTTLTRHYKTAKIGSTAYQYFRKSKDPLITHTMTPYPGRQARTMIQVWQGGKWQLWSGRYTKLSASGKASFTFVTGAKVGKRFRVRAEYLSGPSGDNVNYTSTGAWKYFTYTH